MCQGVIVSLIEFKNQQVILSGIGSHSQLLQDNKQLLIDKGWSDNDTDQNVFSIESDFRKGYGKFTIESGEPDDKQLKLLIKEYLYCAGTDRQLINHVKRCGKIDDSLVKLLTPESKKQYDEARAPIWKQYEEANALILKQYDEARAPIWKQYEEANAPIEKQYAETRAPIENEYEEANAIIWKQYYEPRAPIEKQYYEALRTVQKEYDEAFAPIENQYYEAIAPIRKQYDEALAPFLKQYHEALAPIENQYYKDIAPTWISLFENPENRIEVMR